MYPAIFEIIKAEFGDYCDNSIIWSFVNKQPKDEFDTMPYSLMVRILTNRFKSYASVELDKNGYNAL